MYLQIFSVADITLSDGKQVFKAPLNEHKTPSHRSVLHWSIQGKPHKKNWKIFPDIIKAIYCKPNTFTLKKA